MSEKRVALVTGSTSGIGLGIARLFAARGYFVVIHSRSSAETGRSIAAELDSLYIQADLGNDEERCRLLRQAAAVSGRLDVLVNNAGMSQVIPHQDLQAATPKVWRDLYEVNVIAPFRLVAEAEPYLRAAAGAGSSPAVVNIASHAGVRPKGASIPYSASKAALIQTTKLLAVSLAPEIRVNAVAPGLVDTPLTATWEDAQALWRERSPMRRAATPEDIAKCVLALVEGGGVVDRCYTRGRPNKSDREMCCPLGMQWIMMLAMTSPVPALFDRLADSYDQIIPFFAEFAAQLLEVVDPVPGTRLLDVGSGRGAIAGAAAARGCVVTAVDAAPRMVSLLAAAHPEMDVRLMDAHRLDLPDGSYDLATGGFVIHLVDDRARVLARLRRVLRPGASVALTTPGPCEDHGRWENWNSLCSEFASRAAERSPGGDPEVASYLRAAGFADIRTVSLAVHLPVSDPQRCWDFHMSHGFAGLVESLDAPDAAEFERRALAELSRMHESGGIVLDRGAVAYLATVPGE